MIDWRNARAHTLANWRKRREAKGVAATADDLWARIRHNWPGMDAEDQEWVFQREAQL